MSPESAETGCSTFEGASALRCTPVDAWTLQRLLADPAKVSEADREALPEWLGVVVARLDRSPNKQGRMAALKKGFAHAGLSAGDAKKALDDIGRAPTERPDQEATEDEWEVPVPLPTADLPPFPTGAFPRWIDNLVNAVALANQTAGDLPAMICLSVLATALAGRFELELRRGWVEPLNIWTAVALASGERKSPVLQEIAAPVFGFERTEMERLKSKIAEARARRDIEETALDRAKKDAAKGDGPEADEARQQAIRIEQELATSRVVAEPRLVTQDVTPERLANMMAEHGERMAILSPESEVFDQMTGRYSKDGRANFDIFLKGHSGDQVRVDRRSSDAVLLQRPALTVGLAVQPAALRDLAAARGARGRGVLARFLYAIPPSLVGRRKVNSPPVPDNVRNLYFEGVLALLHSGKPPDGADPDRLTLNPNAHELFLQFEQDIEDNFNPGGTLFGLEDWGGKLAGAVGRIMGLLHLAHCANNATADRKVIEAKTAESAILIGRYLIPHASAAFGLMGANSANEAAQRVLDWIDRTGQERFSKRDAFEALKGRFLKAKDLDDPLHLLEEHGYIRSVEPAPRTGPGRRPSPVLEVNPRAHNSRNSQNGSAS